MGKQSREPERFRSPLCLISCLNILQWYERRLPRPHHTTHYHLRKTFSLKGYFWLFEVRLWELVLQSECITVPTVESVRRGSRERDASRVMSYCAQGQKKDVHQTILNFFKTVCFVQYALCSHKNNSYLHPGSLLPFSQPLCSLNMPWSKASRKSWTSLCFNGKSIGNIESIQFNG